MMKSHRGISTYYRVQSWPSSTELSEETAESFRALHPYYYKHMIKCILHSFTHSILRYHSHYEFPTNQSTASWPKWWHDRARAGSSFRDCPRPCTASQIPTPQWTACKRSRKCDTNTSRPTFVPWHRRTIANERPSSVPTHAQSQPVPCLAAILPNSRQIPPAPWSQCSPSGRARTRGRLPCLHWSTTFDRN
jgi:hypothetical protein